MNNTVDNFMDKARDVADAAGRKTSEIIEVSKLKVQCISINNKIKAVYEKLGSTVYSFKKSDYSNDELVDSMVEEIDELLAELDEVSEKIANIKNVVFCTACGKKNPENAYYCAKCGNRISEEFEINIPKDDTAE